MRKLLPLLMIVAFAATPAIAQEAAASTAPAPAPQVKMVTKVVCQRVDVEATSGSRLSAVPRVCKKVTVPADGSQARNGSGAASSPQGR